MEITFQSPKKVANGTRISLVNPVTLNTPILDGSACPFGIDYETDWKWSIKLEFDSDNCKEGSANEDRFIMLMKTLDRAIVNKIETAWLPTIHNEYFYMHTIYSPQKSSELGSKMQMRVKIPVKNGIATQTHFTGNKEGETERLLTMEDGEILRNHKFQLTLKWSCVWVMDDKKTISCDWAVTHVKLL
jgi:hypothetical protein